MKSRAVIILSFIIIMGFFAFLAGFRTGRLHEGGLYCTRNENGTYSVMKILKLDDIGVHVRLYSNSFKEIPARIDEKALYMAGIDHKPNERLGMGHLPFSRKSFESCNAVFIQNSSITKEELEGYNMWLEAKGGYF